MDQMKPDNNSGVTPALTPEGADSASPRRKTGVVVVAAALFVLVAFAAAAAVYVFVLAPSDSGDPVLAQDVTQETPPPALADADATEPAPVPLKRVFTFRDVFAPLIKPAPAPAPVTPTTDGSTTTTGTADPNDGTITLQDVVAVDGEPAAVLVLDGQTYTLKAGEVISGTPWKVLSISGQTVNLQFGDVPVQLSVGQGITPSVK
ncbi:MAG: type IV pilus biogenesis protein PilP [Anaerosomatales bacterium]|nr:type IV pilus biogenesis protein PilP [Anaerosomatales bacterium]MDT8433206.1 type IV pilus biogenesis protein PilP [Anaerosomatales bacterium]